MYPYEYMDEWEKFNERTLAEKEEFYSNLNKEDIVKADSKHAKKVCEEWYIKCDKSDITVDWCFQKLKKKKAFKNLLCRPRKISFSSWINIASSF